MSLDLVLMVIPLIISFIALIVSIVVAWSNRKSLQVEISPDLQVMEGGRIFFLNDDGIPEPYDHALLATVEVVNPSPKDIAFFDLRTFYPETNMNVDLLTRRAVLEKYRDKKLWRVIKTPSGKERLSELIVPETNYGIFKSNSFTRLHIVTFPDKDDDKILLSFKVAMRSRIKKDPFAVTGRKVFKHYGRAYKINSWQKSLPNSLQ